MTDHNDLTDALNYGYPSPEQAREAAARITELEAQVAWLTPQMVSTVADRDAARAQIAAALAVHVSRGYWTLDGNGEVQRFDDIGEERPFDGYVCLTCSESHVEDDLDNWEMDLTDAGVVEYPCETVRALSSPVTHPEPEPTPVKSVRWAPNGILEAIPSQITNLLAEDGKSWGYAPSEGRSFTFGSAQGDIKVEPGQWVTRYDDGSIVVTDENPRPPVPVVVPGFVDPEPRMRRAKSMDGVMDEWRHAYGPLCDLDPYCLPAPRSAAEYEADQNR